MANATFENHPIDPDKMILRKPRLDQGEDYERGFVDGMQMQVQRCVERNVLGTSCKRSEHWVELMRGVRVEGDTVIISVKGGNDEARYLCGELINEMEIRKE